MTRRRIETTYVGCVAIHADKSSVLINCYQFFRNVLPETFFVVTFSTRCYRDIWFETLQRCRLGDVDVASRTFGKVVLLFSATIVHEPN